MNTVPRIDVRSRWARLDRRTRRRPPHRAPVRVDAAGLLAALPEPLLLLDDDRVVVTVNASARDRLGADWTGRRWLCTPGADETLLPEGILVRLAACTDDQTRALMSRTQAALAHQIRSPLTAAGLSVDYLLLTVEDAEEHARLERVRRSLASIEQLLRNALVFVRGELTERQDFPVEALVGGLREAVAGIAPRARIEWRETFTTDDRVSGDLAALVSALLNLVENALAVGGMDVPITVTARTTSADSLEIEIADRGPGMSAEFLARAKEPFFSGRAGGTGLGLSITDAVVRAHGGRFDLESVLGEGVSARIVLPLLAPLGAGAGR